MTAQPPTRPPARTVGPVRVVGAGLLGASTGMALRALGVEVELADASPSAVALASDLGAGRPAPPAPHRADGAGGGAGPGGASPALVVVAVPPDVTAAVVAVELTAHSRAVVTDVASVKAGVLAQLRADPAAAPSLARYVGSHPMAGRERSGAIAARGDLFLGRPWVVCAAPPHAGSPGSSPAALRAVADLAADLGASTVAMTAAEHDEAVALVSHLPQVAASLVAARLAAAPDAALALTGQGLRDVTRIAASDPALWVQILGANAARVAQVLAPLRDDLDALLGALHHLAGGEDAGEGRGGAERGGEQGGRHAALARALAAGGQGRARLPGKHGSRAADYAAVTVLVADRPGELARLLQDIGEAGVNLEELRLDHSPGRAAGLAEVLVLPAARAALVQALDAAGWAVHGD